MRLLYLAPRPCKALPPGPQAAPLPPDPLRPAAFWKNSPPYVQKLRAPSCSRRNLRHEDTAFIREAYDLRAALFFPAHRMYAPPLAAPKGPAFRDHLPASNPPPSRFSRLYTIPCRYSPWHKAKTHRLDNRTGLALGLHAAGAYPKSQRAPVGIRPLPSGSSCMNGSHVLQAVFRPVSSRIALWRLGIFP